MSYRVFGCGKYRRLMNEKNDRTLGLGEREFMAKHRDVCVECRKQEALSSSALNMLRLASFAEDEDSFDSGLQFEERVLRRLRVNNTRESIRYWSPAFVGAAIAGLTVLAALQLVANRPGMPATSNPAGEAQLRKPNTNLPLIDLDRLGHLK